VYKSGTADTTITDDDVTAMFASLAEGPVPYVAASGTERQRAYRVRQRALVPDAKSMRASPGTGMDDARYSRHRRGVKRAERERCIAVLDFETDPFDNVKRTVVEPFLAVIHSDFFETIVIWDTNHNRLVDRVIEAIRALPGSYTIYAHNGGRFDYKFLLHRLLGPIMLTGKTIMSACVGKHTLRDSMHIIPTRLADYKKDDFDYRKLERMNRDKYREEIIKYCVNDCKYLLELVKGFISRFGLRLTVAQASMAMLKKHHKFECVTERTDTQLREYFFGGRVDCLSGTGHYTDGPYKLYDVNSMYPSVMAGCEHPVGATYIFRSGAPDRNTVFLDLSCYSRGALINRNRDDIIDAPHGYGRYKTTIWEYEMGIKLGLISDVIFHECVDNLKRTNFSNFITEIYGERQRAKEQLKFLREAGIEAGTEYDRLKKDDLFLKLVMNASYGKFAQNPRKFKENYITASGKAPEGKETGQWGYLPRESHYFYLLWERPNRRMRFNNVGTGASITGAARAKLMEAIANADTPIYCDTDSVICKELHNTRLHPTMLGAWSLERKISEIAISGKKSYSYHDVDGHETTRSKGSGTVTWPQMVAVIGGAVITVTAKGPTLTNDGGQRYIDRRLRTTGISRDELNKLRNTDGNKP